MMSESGIFRSTLFRIMILQDNMEILTGQIVHIRPRSASRDFQTWVVCLWQTKFASYKESHMGLISSCIFKGHKLSASKAACPLGPEIGEKFD